MLEQPPRETRQVTAGGATWSARLVPPLAAGLVAGLGGLILVGANTVGRVAIGGGVVALIWLVARWSFSYHSVTLADREILVSNGFRSARVALDEIERLELTDSKVNDVPVAAIALRDGGRRIRFLPASKEAYRALDSAWRAIVGSHETEAKPSGDDANAATGEIQRVTLPAWRTIVETHPHRVLAITAGLAIAGLVIGHMAPFLLLLPAVLSTTPLARKTSTVWILAPIYLAALGADSTAVGVIGSGGLTESRLLAVVGLIFLVRGVLRARAGRTLSDLMRTPGTLSPEARTEETVRAAEVTPEPPPPQPAESSLPPASSSSAAGLMHEYDVERPPPETARGRDLAAAGADAWRSCTRTMIGQAICLGTGAVVAILIDAHSPGGWDPVASFLVPLIVTMVIASIAVPLGILALSWRHGRAASSSLTPAARRWRRVVIGFYGFTICVAAPVTLVHVVLAIASTVKDEGTSSPILASLASLALIGSLVGSAAIRKADKRRVARLTSNAPTLRLLLLRVFRPGAEYEKRVGSVFKMLARQWTLVGNCRLLGGPDWFGEEVAGAGLSWRRARAMIVSTPEEVDERIRGFPSEPRWQRLAGPHAFPHNSLICAGSVWKVAFQKMLEQTDVVLMDLRGFSPENRGCVYELDQLMEQVPTRRFLLLADESMDRPFLETALREAQEKLTEHSPNRRGGENGVRVYSMQPPPRRSILVGAPQDAIDEKFRPTGHARASSSDSPEVDEYEEAVKKQNQDEKNVLSMVWEAAAAAVADRDSS